ncbi:TetR/AcrR family transcriptional regulator [Actinomadura citrea]|uniref:TetR/AcrR family transcriptional regulator n=1 Tax=Actinomadura citrea TaxID=46158 RepID=UPI002E2B64F9|nr:TetR/AcrR family transcriptional regulator [Actinomadura citrea]
MTGPRLDGTRKPRIDRRARLITAASQLFSERAYDEVTTTEIAGRAGVAYGLIAHHFTNKRGLYLATIRAAGEALQTLQETPPDGETPAERLRNAISRHIAYMDRHAAGFLTLIRGGNGSDPEVRAIIEELRWQGALRILNALGVDQPVHPVLRASMRGWVGYLDELIVDHIHHHDIPREDLVRLTISALTATLRTAWSITPDIGIAPATVDLLGA